MAHSPQAPHLISIPFLVGGGGGLIRGPWTRDLFFFRRETEFQGAF